MTELVRRNTDGWADVLPAVGDLAAKVAATDFVPDTMRGKPAVVAAAILYGREIGMEPMTALRSINVIKGKPALSSEAMRALVLAAGHDIRFVEMTATRCVIEGRRKGQEEATRVTYSMDDAKRAGLAGQSQYSKMPRQMLAARATAELCRLIFADVIGGLVADVEAFDEVEAAPAAPATTTARRKAVAAAAAPEPVIVADPEPVIEEVAEEVVDAEIIEEPAATPEDVVRDSLGGQVIGDHARGAALVREALSATKQANPIPISKQQLVVIVSRFGDLNIKDRDERLAVSSKLIGRPLASANDLTHNEASTLIDALRAISESPDPQAELDGLLP
jgi:hypothetical protein